MDAEYQQVSLAELRRLVVGQLLAADVSESNAAYVADALVAAEADGIGSHGVARVPDYAEQALSGKVRGRAQPQLTQSAPGLLHVDAEHGFAYPAIAQGLEVARKQVQQTGIVALSVSRSHHAGMLAYHLEPLARDGLLALGFSNTPAALAPWGGQRPLFGTNPIAFACPGEVGGEPLVIDLSLSRVARGKIMLAKQSGQPIPPDWALDADGQPTTAADAAMAGSLLPIGEMKGALLALMVEILAAGLSGSNFGFQAGSFFEHEGEPPAVGQLFLVFEPNRLSGVDFHGHLQALLQAMLAQDGVRLPGARRFQQRLLARREGVKIPLDLYRRLRTGLE